MLGPPWLKTAHHRLQIDSQWLVVMMAMLASALVFFGWRGLIGVLVTTLAAVIVHQLLAVLAKLVRPTLHRGSLSHALVLGLLLGASMPLMRQPALHIAAGAVLGVISHMVGRSHWLRVHPVAVVLVLCWVAPGLRGFSFFNARPEIFQKIDSVLRPKRLILGDVTDLVANRDRTDPWLSTYELSAPAAVLRPDPDDFLLAEANRDRILTNRDFFVDKLSSGELCRIEEMFIGATIDSTGATSRFLLIVLGFYLMYRRLATWWLVCWALLAAIATLLCMPVVASGHMVAAHLVDLRPAAAITCMGYFLFAPPLVLIFAILAPTTAPMSRTGRFIYALLLGVLSIVFTWFFESAQASYLSLLVVGLLSRPLDALQRCRL